MNAHITWRSIEIEIRHQANWLNSDYHHIEIITDPRTPLPITETGYRSHFMLDEAFGRYDNAQAFVAAWLEEAAKDWDGQLALL